MNAEIVIFNGVTYRRYPDAESRSDRVYYLPGIADAALGVGRLHVEIWKATHGPVPKGYHIHHIDHDPLNNDIENLEALPAAEHRRRHADEGGRDALRTDEWLEHLTEIRPLAAAWHGSDEGRAWHSEHGRRVAGNREERSAVCEQCGVEFTSLSPLRFCSNKCKSAWRRSAGLDDETRSCEVCGESYRANRYARTRTCSRKCGGSLRRQD